MQIHCFNIERAITYLEKSSDENAKHFINVLKEHAVDQDVRITFNQGNLVNMTFTSTHEVSQEIDTGDFLIIIHSVGNAASVIISELVDEVVCDIDGVPVIDASGNTIPEQRNNQTTSTESKTMNTESSNNNSATQQQAAAPQQPAPAPAAEDNQLALKIGKAVLYTAGAGAAIAAGVWAWKKWGSSTTTTTTV